MKGKLQLLPILLGVGMSFAQHQHQQMIPTKQRATPSNRVGINTESPESTLHVNGTVSVSELGPLNEDALLVGVSKNSTQLGVLDPQFKMIETKRIEVPYTKREHLDYNLNIDANAYEVALLYATLTSDNGVREIKAYSISDKDHYGGVTANVVLGDDNDKIHTNVLTGLAFHRAGATWLTSEYTKDNDQQQPYIIQGNTTGTGGIPRKNEHNVLVYSPPKFLIENKNGKWHITGGYYGTETIDSDVVDNKIRWRFDLLVVNKSFIIKEPKRIIKIGGAESDQIIP